MYANVLRAGTLTDERIVRRVSDYFVPTHFNNDDPNRDRASPSHQLWRSILKQKDLQGQGLWIVAPDGTVLAGMSAEIDGKPSERLGKGPGAPWQPNRRFADAAEILLDDALKRFGPVSRRAAKPQPLEFRGAGVKPDGGVRLIALSRSDHGLAFSVVLSRDAWEAFRRPKPVVGERWSLPESVARRFAPVLSPYADTRFRPLPEQLKSAQLTATVESISDGQASVRLMGEWHADWTHDNNEHSLADVNADGFLFLDARTGTPERLLMIFDGTYSYANPSRKHQREPVGTVVRWRRDGDAE